MAVSSHAPTNAERLAVIETNVNRIMKAVEGNGVPGLGTRMVNIEFAQQETVKLLNALNNKLDCHIEDEIKREEKNKEKKSNRWEKVAFEILKWAGAIFTAFVLIKLGLS